MTHTRALTPLPQRHERKSVVTGLTLIELIATLVASLVLAGVIVTVYLTDFKGFGILTAKISVSSQLQSAMEQIGRDVRAANLATTGTAPTSLSLTGGSLLNPVTYKCSGPTACVVGTPGNLQRKVGTNPEQTIAHEVIGLSFNVTGVTNKRVDVMLRLREKILGTNGYYTPAAMTDSFLERSPSP